MILTCKTCARVLIPGEVYADGYADGESLCHNCYKLRNRILNQELSSMPVEEQGNEDTEELRS